jgi:hypothetical protein
VSLAISSLISAAENGASAFPDGLSDTPENSDGVAADALFSALYSELHTLARRELARRMAPVSLSVTTLLHEAYLDMSTRVGSSFPDGHASWDMPRE